MIGAHHDGELAGEVPAPPRPALVPQAHGGALLAAGVPGHRGGGGRPKEELRERMRLLLAETLAAMAAALRGERLARDAGRALLDDPDVRALPDEARAAVARAAARHLTAALSARELAQYHDALARYGVGTQDEREVTKSEVRYVVRFPVRPALPAAGVRSPRTP